MAGPSADKTAALMVVQMEWLSAAKKAEYWVEHSAALLVERWVVQMAEWTAGPLAVHSAVH